MGLIKSVGFSMSKKWLVRLGGYLIVEASYGMEIKNII